MSIAIAILSIALGFCIGGLFTLSLCKDYGGFYCEYPEKDPSDTEKKDDEPKV